jgi:hypothetical protein
LRALADFIKSNSGGWWFRVPVLSKTGEETATAPRDKYLLCLESPLGLSTETLVEGLICLNFMTLTKNECKFNKGAWVDFGAHYRLGNLLEITPSTLLRSEGRQRHHHVKLGRPNDNDSASECVAKAKAVPDFRIPRRLGSGRRQTCRYS